MMILSLVVSFAVSSHQVEGDLTRCTTDVEGAAMEVSLLQHGEITETRNTSKGESASSESNETFPVATLEMNATASGRSGVAGACSPGDVAALHAAGGGHDGGSVGGKTATCASNAYSIWWGLNEESFVSCVHRVLGISYGCADCFRGAARYGADNCKFACLTSWCSQGCLSCVQHGENGVERCTGVVLPKATSCR
eukprot:TRINITY_DN5928_c0_g1_i1.p1 TRINITY_DN5928_c0_g1~~TRINITY_DN5928_c0_g1_i1.p1  ORF type:complete len:196 (+),score=28.65 TRINITY_DN5928_c0_g1_i1:90-677(+)